MLYCPNCQTLYEDSRCPVCGRAKGRPPKDDDLCLVAEKGRIEADMLEDILRQNGIPCLKQSVSGAAIALYTGLYLERFRVLTAYDQWETAREIAEEFFSTEGEFVQEEEMEGEEDEPDDD